MIDGTGLVGTDVELRALCPAFGVEVLGLDLSEQLDDARFAVVHDAFVAHQLVLLRDQDVPPGRQVELARRFGEVQIHVMSQYHADGHPELYFLSNLDEDGQPSGRHPDKGTLEWHTDGSWRRTTGHATIMYAVEVPSEGGETHFCDMYGAYEALPEVMREELQGMRAVHNLDFSRRRRHGEDPMSEEQRKEVPPVDHPVVRTHPDTGRKCLFLGDHAEHIQGLPYSKGRAFIDTLNEQIVQPELIYEHHWQPGDLAIWDNRCLLHRATLFDASTERRVMRRCTVLGDAPR